MKAIRSFTVGWLRTALVAILLTCASVASAQRVQFPTMVDAAPPPSLTTPTPWTTAQGTMAAPSASPLSSVPYDPYASPLAQTPPPTFSPPPAYSPYSPSPYAAPPATPYSPTPSSLYPEGIPVNQPTMNFGQPLKFLQDLRLRGTWLSPMGSESLGVTDVDTNVTFAFPFMRTTSPLMLTPGFSIHWFDGPVTQPPYFAELPARTYDAYLDTAWYPQLSSWFSAQIGVRVGAYTDFNTFNTHSIRVMGRGLGVIRLTPTLQFALGAVYLDRVLIKILPAGGLIWTPNADSRYELLFPNPKGSKRWTTLGNTDVWVYLTGEYGGGSWTGTVYGASNQFDYNDLRVALGVESFSLRGLHAFFEVGYVWDRKIIYRYTPVDFPASDTIMLRGGVAY